MDNHVSRVMRTIYRKPGAPVARGELVLDPAFARAFMKWRTGKDAETRISNADLLVQCCQSLDLDLVCLQSGALSDDDPGLLTHLNDVGAISRKGFFVFWIVNGAFQSLMGQRGMTDLMMAIAGSPRGVRHDLEKISDGVVACMQQGVDAGAHGIIIADDIAYHRSTYMAPDFVKQYLLPVWKVQVNAARALGVPVFFHSDGNLNAVLSTIVAAGFDGLQCIEPAAGMDLLHIKKTYGKELCLMGNVDPSLLCQQDDAELPQSADHRLAQAVKDLMACNDGHGGLIFGTCSGLHAAMHPERVAFMYRLASELEHRP